MGDQQIDAGNIYHIRVKGNLDEKWADWFEGFIITSRDSGETLMSGRVADQAALHGVLGKIRGLNLPLLLVVQAEYLCSKTNCTEAKRPPAKDAAHQQILTAASLAYSQLLLTQCTHLLTDKARKDEEEIRK